jgi:hypothetical protein
VVLRVAVQEFLAWAVWHQHAHELGLEEHRMLQKALEDLEEIQVRT